MGEAKNWEKLGSWAVTTLARATQIVRVERSFFISAIKFFALPATSEITRISMIINAGLICEIALLGAYLPCTDTKWENTTNFIVEEISSPVKRQLIQAKSC